MVLSLCDIITEQKMRILYTKATKKHKEVTTMRLKDKEYFSGTLAEMHMLKEDVPTLKRSSSYGADRSVGFLGLR